jgi:hypothetical protein
VDAVPSTTMIYSNTYPKGAKADGNPFISEVLIGDQALDGTLISGYSHSMYVNVTARITAVG